ncbi:DNA primase [Ideonella sp. B7]|uniref:DNA primase n=1 Tax=Ideonella benzenivorans TaxID=2831643 RepID=UPI001CED2289|nr:DNA primase [Ideonella benzenivorans]MCA6217527.1 DNA primase [Ideonella benzenivorans]
MIPHGFIQDLLSRVDIVDVVGRHVELKKAGINHKGLCPFHGEKTPSFIVSPTRQTYHCFGCGAHGDAIRFLTELHGMSFVEAVQDLAQQVGMQVPEDERSVEEQVAAAEQRQRQRTLSEVLERAAQHYRHQLKGSQRAIAYLKGRGLSGEIAQRFGLGYAPDGWHSLASAFARYDDPLLVEAGLVILHGEEGAEQRRYDRFRDRIMFPIRNVKGETIAFGGRVLDKGEPKYLNSPETPVFVKGRELYGLYEARGGLREKGYALVTEGYMDVVALAQLGFPNAVATLGTACTADHVHKLLRFTEQVVFSFDGDAAGRRAAGRALEAALPHASDTRSFRFLFLPPEHDPDSYVRAFGPQAFEAQVRDAVPLSRQLLDHVATDCDLATAEGRARMLAQAKPLWQALPDGALKLQLQGELARLGSLPTEELARLWHDGAPRARPAPTESADGTPPDAIAPRSAGRPWPRRPFPGRDRGARQSGGFGSRRLPPKRPEDRVMQMLFGQPGWWLDLPPMEQEFLHALPPPHGPLAAWLERDLAEHGPRPWAVLKEVLAQDPGLDDEARGIADGDADPGATPEDLRRALDVLMERELGREMQALLAEAAHQPDLLARYRELDRQWREVKLRLAQASTTSAG